MSLLYSRFAVFVSLLVALLVSPSFQLDTQEVFIVLDSCNPHDAVVRPALQEVVDMCQAAINDINTALDTPLMKVIGSTKSKRLRVVRTLRTFWGIDFSDNRLKISDAGKATAVRDNFQKIIDFTKILRTTPERPNTWRLACDDTWLKVVEAADLPGKTSSPLGFEFFDPGPAPGSDSYLNPELLAVTTGPNPRPAPGRAGPCANNPREGAFTMGYPRYIITFCPNAFGTFPADGSRPARTLMASTRGATAATDGTAYVDQYFSFAGLFLHEMTHQLFKTDDNIGYGFALSQGATTGQENNADTYALYATASFLNTYDWNTGRAAAIGA